MCTFNSKYRNQIRKRLENYKLAVTSTCLAYIEPLEESAISSFPFLHHKFLIWFLKPFLVAETWFGKGYEMENKQENKRVIRLGTILLLHSVKKTQKSHTLIYDIPITMNATKYDGNTNLLIEHAYLLLHARDDLFG